MGVERNAGPGQGARFRCREPEGLDAPVDFDQRLADRLSDFKCQDAGERVPVGFDPGGSPVEYLGPAVGRKRVERGSVGSLYRIRCIGSSTCRDCPHDGAVPGGAHFEEGVENETLSSIIARNVRLPAIVMGDIRAQLSSINVGERGLRKLLTEHGREVLLATFDDILAYTEGIVREEIARLPDGTYSFDDYIDDDGFGSGPIRISARVEIQGDRLHVDFEGTSGQVMSALNATTSFTRASVYAAFLCVTPKTEILNNDGLYRAITVSVPEGSILNPRRPAPRAARGLTGFRVIDAVIGAFHKAVPERCFAAGEGGPTMISIGTVDPDGLSHVFVDFVCGGWGGRQTQDGVDAICPLGANLANVPVEQIERDYSIIVDEYSFVPDTGGPGANRGCLSIARQLRFVGDWGVLSIRSDRRDHPPYGLDGGLPGSPSWNVLNPGRPDEVLLPTKFTRDIKHGDVLRHVMAGGGGVGVPQDRSAELIAYDLEEGKITQMHARTVYGFTGVTADSRSSVEPHVHA